MMKSIEEMSLADLIAARNFCMQSGATMQFAPSFIAEINKRMGFALNMDMDWQLKKYSEGYKFIPADHRQDRVIFAQKQKKSSWLSNILRQFTFKKYSEPNTP